MVVKNCTFQISNIYAIRKFLDRKCLRVLVHSLVVSKIDYYHSLYVSLPNYLRSKLQSVINKSARLMYSLPPLFSTASYRAALAPCQGKNLVKDLFVGF